MQANESARRQMAEHRIHIMRSGESLERLTKSADWKVLDGYFANRQNELVNNLCAPSSGGDGMTLALRAENDKGALQEIRRFIATMSGILHEYHQMVKANGGDVEEVPQTASPPKSEAEFAAPEGPARADILEEKSDA